MEEKDQEIKMQNELSWCIEKLSYSISQGKLSDKKGNQMRVAIHRGGRVLI